MHQRIAGEDDFLKELHDLRLPQGGGDLAGSLDRVEEIMARRETRISAAGQHRSLFPLTDLGRTKLGLRAAMSRRRACSCNDWLRLAKNARLAVADLGQR